MAPRTPLFSRSPSGAPRSGSPPGAAASADAAPAAAAALTRALQARAAPATPHAAGTGGLTDGDRDTAHGHRSVRVGAGRSAASAAATPSTRSASGAVGAFDGPPASADPPAASPPPARAHPRRERLLWALALLLVAGLAGWPGWAPRLGLMAAPPPLTMKRIEAELRAALIKQPLPARTAAAYAAIAPSVVRIEGRAQARAEPPPPRGGRGPTRTQDRQSPGHGAGMSVGTGVVIVDSGLILTNLHVVDGADELTVTFADGSDSPAQVVSRDPSQDLAVLQASRIPDDLHAATLRSTQGLAPGEPVMAVGHPFGIGPSASSGVVSGLGRAFRSPGGSSLSNLIQFDAAANPGNSGGPLVTLDGHVVGIVTAIMNPTPARTFIGIGFAVPIESAAGAVGMPPF